MHRAKQQPRVACCARRKASGSCISIRRTRRAGPGFVLENTDVACALCHVTTPSLPSHLKAEASSLCLLTTLLSSGAEDFLSPFQGSWKPRRLSRACGLGYSLSALWAWLGRRLQRGSGEEPRPIRKARRAGSLKPRPQAWEGPASFSALKRRQKAPLDRGSNRSKSPQDPTVEAAVPQAGALRAWPLAFAFGAP